MTNLIPIILLIPVLIFIVMSLLTIVPECCLAWTDPRIFNILENYVGEIKLIIDFYCMFLLDLKHRVF